MDKKIFITGATGNVGHATLRYLLENAGNRMVFAGIRNPARYQNAEKDPRLEYVGFDFENPDTYGCFKGIYRVFLLRPPQISNVKKFFIPLLNSMKNQGVQEIVFLSVQGVENSSFIPHFKIEKLIQKLEFRYVFLRPSYFMQNLSTTFLTDIRDRKILSVPSGSAVFNWIDVENIGEVASTILLNFDDYAGKKMDITGSENKSFGEVAQILSKELETSIKFESPNFFRFYRNCRQKGIESGMIIVMLLLHVLPRFQKAPVISDAFIRFTGKSPNVLSEFIHREKQLFIP